MTTTAPKPELFRAPRVIFWVAFLVRIACIAIGHTYRIRVIGNHFDFAFEAGRIAKSLVEGHGYANPFNGWSGPTAWLPPLYPLLVALSFKLFGIYTNAAAFFVMTVDSLFSALIVPAVYEIAARCFDARGIARRASTKVAPIALWSAWLWALYPAALQYAVHWLWDTSLSASLFTWTIVLALRLRGTGEDNKVEQFPHRDSSVISTGAGLSHRPAQRRDLQFSPSDDYIFRQTSIAGANQPWRWIAFGALWGLVTLSNASLLLCLPPMGLWIIWPQLRADLLRRPLSSLRQLWHGPVLAVVFFALVMTPWWVRNARTLHTFIATRANFGAELYESVLPSHDAFPWGPTLPMWPGDPKFQLYVHMGEVRYSHMREQQAITLIRANPGMFWHHAMDRFLFFWINVPHPLEKRPMQEYGRRLNYSFLTLAGLMGLWLALRRRVPGAALMGWIFLLMPLPYYFVTVQARFRHPLEPLITILGVYLFRASGPRRASPNRKEQELSSP